MTRLGDMLKEARAEKGWTLRHVEKLTGIHNAHLSQVENGQIENPELAMLWRLAEVYNLDYQKVLVAAGLATRQRSANTRRLQGAAMRAIDDLGQKELREALDYLEGLRNTKKR